MPVINAAKIFRIENVHTTQLIKPTLNYITYNILLLGRRIVFKVCFEDTVYKTIVTRVIIFYSNTLTIHLVCTVVQWHASWSFLRVFILLTLVRRSASSVWTLVLREVLATCTSVSLSISLFTFTASRTSRDLFLASSKPSVIRRGCRPWKKQHGDLLVSLYSQNIQNASSYSTAFESSIVFNRLCKSCTICICPPSIRTHLFWSLLLVGNKWWDHLKVQ